MQGRDLTRVPCFFILLLAFLDFLAALRDPTCEIAKRLLVFNIYGCTDIVEDFHRRVIAFVSYVCKCDCISTFKTNKNTA